MNRFEKLFDRKPKDVLNLYFTAGHPTLDSTAKIIRSMVAAGVDIVEIGMPYSDPLADGLTIQQSSQKALKNGMNLQLLFEQVQEVRSDVEMPLIMMGYLNQVLQYGTEQFLKQASASGIDGLILPDLPMNIYEREYKSLFEKHGICITFLVTPQTSDERILKADELSNGFLYIVSQSSITGSTESKSALQEEYFQRLKRLNLKSNKLVGFGIHDKSTYDFACAHGNGAIIGSAFIRMLEKSDNVEADIHSFVLSLGRQI